MYFTTKDFICSLNFQFNADVTEILLVSSRETEPLELDACKETFWHHNSFWEEESTSRKLKLNVLSGITGFVFIHMW